MQMNDNFFKSTILYREMHPLRQSSLWHNPFWEIQLESLHAKYYYNSIGDMVQRRLMLRTNSSNSSSILLCVLSFTTSLKKENSLIKQHSSTTGQVIKQIPSLPNFLYYLCWCFLWISLSRFHFRYQLSCHLKRT